MDETIRALAYPTRREILRLLRGGDLAAGAIAARFDMTAPTVSHPLCNRLHGWAAAFRGWGRPSRFPPPLPWVRLRRRPPSLRSPERDRNGGDIAAWRTSGVLSLD